MNIKIIALGKIKEKFLKDGIAEFMKRLKPYVSVEIIEIPAIEIKDERLTQKILDDEAEKILSRVKPFSYLITLEISGKMLSSEEFAQKIEKIAGEGFSEIVFVIGSSCGISNIVSEKADFKLSLSKMTFLHQFARLILVEQIYRSFKIIKHETYHK